jgi:phospholipid/cholesterol/gamma-HCH transport system permease protein
VTTPDARTARPSAATALLGRVGEAALDALQVIGEAATLLVATARRLRFRRPDVERLVVQLVRIGTETLPIAALLSLFVGMVLVVQTADQVRQVGQGVLGPIVGLAMTKELGPTMMAFLLAGRAGSAIAAELGAMAVYEEIAALRTLDVDPVRFLVQPRLLAATIALPLLILYADFVGIAGGALVVWVDPAIKISPDEFLARMLEWVHLRDVLIGLGKGAVFGLAAALLPCTWGLRTRGGADRIAVSTTAAVVWSFVLILVFDFIIVRGTFLVTT